MKLKDLSSKAQEIAYRNWLPIAVYPNAEENELAMRKFCERFGVKVDNFTYGGPYPPLVHLSEVPWDAADIKGNRLRDYLQENSGDMINEVAPFTGAAVDEDLLDPIRQFLKWPDENTTLEELLYQCLNEWVRCCHFDFNEYHRREHFEELAEINDWRFRECGCVY